ncbi:hypothetical protein [Silanimonas sp.]|uniref:hypothetical protein n=1 Tax=Silanimonas sp. TaxID=1929290 RepID=UPI0022C882F3|nr:hypothetical protein [Silanimonas sp.]MCZ8062098.1 hypothetical protein [Silanimonas sp.]
MSPEARAARSARAAAWLPWGVALLAAAALFTLFAPGWFTFDTAHQWWMARTGQLDSTHPAVMVRLWQASRALLPDPEGFFALQLLLVWSGLAFVATALPLRTPWRVAVLLGIGLWPAFVALQPQVWKDLWMVGALLWAVGALLREQAEPAWRWRGLALLMLALATAFRFNAITGVLPLWAWLAWRIARVPVGPASEAGATPRAARWRIAAAALSLPLLLGLAAVPDRLGAVKHVTVWPVMALWDLAAVSIETGRMAIPAAFLKPGATVDDLAREFDPAVNVPSFTTGTIHFSYEIVLRAEDLATLREAWLMLPLREPQAWARHRLRLSGYLFGLRNAELADTQVLMPDLVPFKDNPPLTMAPSRLREVLVATWHRWVDGPFFMGWLYLLLAAGVLAAAAWRRRTAAAALSASGLAMVAPLVPLATAADFRYLLWLVVASLVAFVLLVSPAPRAGR